jgi:penicillin-insensitive murein endopeptidase
VASLAIAALACDRHAPEEASPGAVPTAGSPGAPSSGASTTPPEGPEATDGGRRTGAPSHGEAPEATDGGRRTGAPSHGEAPEATDGGRRTGAPSPGEAPEATREPSPDPDPRDLAALPPARSTSIGAPNNGRLEGAVAFPLSGPGFRFNPRRRPEARYGTVELVQALARAARAVAEAFPGAELTVNDLSLEGGGPIAHHGSHQNGRDVDTLFYLRDAEGRPYPSVGAPLDPEGRGVDFKDLADPDDDVEVRIDLPRTWRFVEKLLADPRARVQRIYVAEHLRTLLLAEARRAGAPPRVLRRFRHVTCQPSYPHDDHFHIRLFCSPQDLQAGCEDRLPLYPWHRRHLAEAGVEPRISRRPKKRSPKITTADEAKAAAGAMHERVRAFLARREAWMDKPHPGRPYCP